MPDICIDYRYIYIQASPELVDIVMELIIPISSFHETLTQATLTTILL